MTYRTLWLTGVACALAVVRPANADPVRYEMNSSAELTDDGWQEFAASTSTFTNGTLEVTYPAVMQWALFDTRDASRTALWSYISPERGWWVEARISQDAPSGAGGHSIGFEINDGRTDVRLTLGLNDVLLQTPEETHYTFDAHDFHVYRVQRPSPDLIQLVIDGEQVLSVSTPEPDSFNGGILKFGSISENFTGAFDYIAYDTAAPGTEEDDDDGDGIPLARDLCPLVDDDGADTDLDREGDACDVCVNDEADDADRDGLCADEDICPNNANNPDANANNLCDDDECKADLPHGYEFAAQGSEGAEVCETAGIRCACYNREAALGCQPLSSCDNGCDCRFAGMTSPSATTAVSAPPSSAPPSSTLAGDVAAPPSTPEDSGAAAAVIPSNTPPSAEDAAVSGPVGSSVPTADSSSKPTGGAPTSSATGASSTNATSAPTPSTASGKDVRASDPSTSCALTPQRTSLPPASGTFYLLVATSVSCVRRRLRGKVAV